MIVLLGLSGCPSPAPSWEPQGTDVEGIMRDVPVQTAEDLRPRVDWLARWAVVGTPHRWVHDVPVRARDEEPQPNSVSWDATNGVVAVATEHDAPWEVLLELHEYRRLSAFRIVELDVRACDLAALEWVAGPAPTPEEEKSRWTTMKAHCQSALEPLRAQGAERGDLDRVAATAEENGWWSR